jgi:hypothetical protein
MYEMRQRQRKEMRQKKWFYYALLAAAIFIFSQGTAIIKTNMGYSLPLILISFILHSTSTGNLTERIFKIKASITANIAMLAALAAVTAICYFNQLHLLHIVLIDFASIAIYVAVAALCSKFKIGDK